MSSPIVTLLSTTLKQTFSENANFNCSNNAVTLLKAAKGLKIQSIMKFKNSVFILPASQPAVRPGYARCMAPEFLHSKGYQVGFTKLSFLRTFICCAMVLTFILY